MKTKVWAFALVAMLTLAGVFVFSVSDESDATTTAGQLGVYVNYGVDSGDYSLWNGGNASGYNAYMALAAYCAAQNKNLVADGNYTISTSYTTINSAYGTVTSIGNYPAAGTANTWFGFYFSVDTNQWEPMDVAPGFYKPFSDYDIKTRAANVAFFCGTADQATTAITHLPTSHNANGIAQYFSTPVVVSSSTVPATTFRIIPTAVTEGSPICQHYVDDDGESYMTVVGYGSDAYLALKNAMDTLNVPCSHYTFYSPTTLTTNNAVSLNENYSHMTKLFNLTESGSATAGWHYWSTYTGVGNNTTYCSLFLGFYANGGVSGYNSASYTLDYVFSPPYPSSS